MLNINSYSNVSLCGHSVPLIWQMSILAFLIKETKKLLNFNFTLDLLLPSYV